MLSVAFLFALLAALSCAAPNKLSKTAQNKGWQLLFDGQTTKGWHAYNQKGTTGWAAKDGELIALGQEGGSHDIVSDEIFGDFDLSIEWKIAPGGNSGIFFNVVESPQYEAIYATGPEYQLVDDLGFPQKLEDWQKTAANYAMHPPMKNALRPVGQYNLTRLIVQKGHVEHWLNGEKIVEYQLWSPEWENLVKAGKWKDYPMYGRAKRGHLALQDHGKQTWFKNIKIRAL